MKTTSIKNFFINAAYKFTFAFLRACKAYIAIFYMKVKLGNKYMKGMTYAMRTIAALPLIAIIVTIIYGFFYYIYMLFKVAAELDFIQFGSY